MYRNSPISAWRNQKHRYQLQGCRCSACGALWYPRMYVCTCAGRDFLPYNFSGKATLVSYTQLSIAAIEFAPSVPYIVGLLQLDEGPRLLAQIADAELTDLSIGMRMVSAFRRYFAAGDAGMIFYGIKFVPEEFA